MDIEKILREFEGNALKIARQSRMMSQSQLAKKTGIPQGTISKFENGLQRPNESTLQKLADATQYKIGFFADQHLRHDTFIISLHEPLV